MILLFLFLFSVLSAYSGKSYKNYGYYQFFVESAKDLKTLRLLDQRFHCTWLYPHEAPFVSLATNVSFLVQPEDSKQVQNLLAVNRIDYSSENTIDKDIQNIFRNFRKSNTPRILSEQLGSELTDGEIILNEYNNLRTIYQWLEKLNRTSEIVNVEKYGASIEDRNLLTVQIGPLQSDVRSILIDCGIHAREWISVSVCLYLISTLASSEGEKLRENVRWVIYPVLNPDGYEFSWTTDRFWRKNRRNHNKRYDYCNGVDLNRNYDSEWGFNGASKNKCRETYAGRSPFSEPESNYHKKHIEKIQNVVAAVSFHSYSEVILFPYSSSHEKEAVNRQELQRVSRLMSQAIQRFDGHRYRWGEGASLMYQASGGSDDWMHSSGVPLSFTIELRDGGKFGFLLPENQILSTCKENLAALTVLKELVEKRECNQMVCDYELTPFNGNASDDNENSNISFENDCKEKGKIYEGKINQTQTGILCQRWDSLSPHYPKFRPENGIQHNFCRNPDFDSNGPWCYTTDPTVRFDYCDIPDCNKESLIIEEVQNRNCTTTREGFTCQRWDKRIPHRPKYKPKQAHHNFCRNPDNDPRGDWCYTTHFEKRFDYCDVTNC